MKDVETFIDGQVALIRTASLRMRKENETKEKEVLHSLPISTEERDKREHEVEEQRRFRDMPGTFNITRNSDGYITKIRKQVEDVVFETDYSRDTDNYITGIVSQLKKETRA